MTRKAQAIIEFSLVFFVVAALILGLLVLWRWSKDNIPARQTSFEYSRIKAGKNETPGYPEPDGTVFTANSPGEPYMLSK